MTVKQFMGWLLIGVGGLIAGTTGACTLYFLFMPFFSGDGGGWSGVGQWILLVLAVGGLPCVVGVSLVFAGRNLIKKKPRRPSLEAFD